MHSASPYLKQHAHNPVYWYPWGEEAIARARAENKPILLSIGYSTCYWCHVMEREVFMNVSIAAQMNEHFVNIKVDREEHPAIDDIYMTARQLMTREGGWPNNVFLTPDLKPFYAGGTFAASEAQGRASFPRLLEWLNYAWREKQPELRETAENVAEALRQLLVYAPAAPMPPDIAARAAKLFSALKDHHDARSGGFFQAPKFPHENYLQFLLAYDTLEARDIAVRSLKAMAAGGIHDHVGCGFHRYAVDKEWYIPHFEKMLYTQAMLARAYTDAARLTGNPWLADIAKSILDFVLGPLTDGSGGFYSGIDAETDEVEGGTYAWTPKEIESVLLPEEMNFTMAFYALADIPQFPGHKHTEGKALILRQPLDEAADAHKMPYVQLAAMCGHVMNKLLSTRNLRKQPGLDDKIIVSWNGLMIDALAHAGKLFGHARYSEAAARAADFLLEQAIDNDGRLQRIVAAGRAQIAATLEDYAYLVKGLLSLTDQKYIDAAVSLMERAGELFYDCENGGYFFTSSDDGLWVRIKNGDDSAMPSANAVMLDNLAQLYEITGDEAYKTRAFALRDFFLSDDKRTPLESASMIQAAMRLEKPSAISTYVAQNAAEILADAVMDEAVQAAATLTSADTITVTLDIKNGWHVNANPASHPFLVPTQVDVQGAALLEVIYPEPLRRDDTLIYEGRVNIVARIAPGNTTTPRIRLRYQPCTGGSCQPVRDIVIPANAGI